MIYAYTGKTGSGKTLSMIRDIYPRWYRGTDIYANTFLLFERFGGKAGTNILDNPENFSWLEHAINWVYFKWCLHRNRNYIPKKRGRIIYFEDITELLEVRNGIILVDEGQALLEARNWEALPAEFSNKLRQHRKHNLDLYVTTQNLGTIDINLRRLVQVWVHCTDVFALFWKRNPSWLTVHRKDHKDIDQLYNNVDDLLVNNLHSSFFLISLFTTRLYDTYYDIGFTTLKSVWLQENNKKKLLIVPKTWSLANVRTQQLLLKFYLDQRKSISSDLN